MLRHYFAINVGDIMGCSDKGCWSNEKCGTGSVAASWQRHDNVTNRFGRRDQNVFSRFKLRINTLVSLGDMKDVLLRTQVWSQRDDVVFPSELCGTAHKFVVLDYT